MNAVRSDFYFLLSILIFGSTCRPTAAQLVPTRANISPVKANSGKRLATTIQSASAEREGQHDFDFNIGTWQTHIKRLVHPLTGSNNWVECEGTTIVRKIWDGRANLVELKADGPDGHFEGLSLRLYSPQSHQWNLNFAGVGGGTLSQPTVARSRMGAASFSTRKRSMDVPS